jgi:hypothetical protein
MIACIATESMGRGTDVVIWFPSSVRCKRDHMELFLYKMRLAKRPMEFLQRQHTKKKCSQ